MTHAWRTRFGRLGWGLASAGVLLGSPGATLAASLSDLVVTALTNPPSTAPPGSSFTVTATIKNRGGLTAPPSMTTFSLITQDGKTQKDLGGVQSVPSLPAGKTSAPPAATVILSNDTPPGVYYLWACADGTHQFTEADDNNNCRKSGEKVTVPALPDL